MSKKEKTLQEIDVAKPVLDKKPVKPKKPAAAETKQETKVYWSTSSASKEFNLVEILKSVPKEVDYADLSFWLKTTSRYDYNYGGHKTTTTLTLGTKKDVVDAKSLAAHKKYKEEIASFDQRMNEWLKNKEEYEKKLEVYNQYRDLADARAKKDSLLKKAKQLVVQAV